jgi:ribosomal protein S18 acetylase RimI-like enzyme
MEIKALCDTGWSEVYKAFSLAFADYEVQVNELQWQAMMRRRGFQPQLSFGAFDGDKLVAFTLNGIGEFGGIPTAYDTGTGTAIEYRKQGLATRIFEYSLPYLREAGIRQYLLEVLKHNTGAVSVYRNLGFEVTREFNYFGQVNEAVHLPASSCEVKEVDVDMCLSVSGFCDFPPSWQNDFSSIKRALEGFLCLGAFIENRLSGYCIFEPVSGDVTQLAVESQLRRQGIGSALLREAVKQNRHTAIKVINTDTACTCITNFLKAKNIELKGQQFEMVKTL